MTIDALIAREGWEVQKENGVEFVEVMGQRFPKTHPVAIHLRLYRTERNPDRKYEAMKAAHDYLWPDTVWHYWTERRFREHCAGWSFISWAGGASKAKSYDAAKIGLLFWLANPKNRGVLIASTTLSSSEARVWGYLKTFIRTLSQGFPIKYMKSMPPRVLYDYRQDSRASTRNIDDTIHGMFSIAIPKNEGSTEDDRAIKNWIGRHPNDALMLILDEGPDLSTNVMKALPNLDSGKEFQCLTIGNSASKFDLHGAMSTPRDGWNTIDPMRDIKWETTQKNGVCLFFPCYESPAIHEQDPVKKEKLSKFLITETAIKEKEKLFGKDSDSFWRFVFGFWRSSSTDDTVVSEQFISDFGVFGKAEWSGFHPLHIVGGLDPAFSVGGDQCILRLAVLGQTTSGKIVLDYRGEELVFRIQIQAREDKSAEIQIAEQVIDILKRFGCELHHVCVDANGLGRGLGEVIKLRAGALRGPMRIYSLKTGVASGKAFDVIIKSAHELWFTFRDFIQNRQIFGLDQLSVAQLTSRKIKKKGPKQELEEKQEYKVRMGAVSPQLARSPDEADAAALALQSAIMNFGFVPGQARALPSADGIDEKYWVFNQSRKIEEQHAAATSPVASFETSLEASVSFPSGLPLFGRE